MQTDINTHDIDKCTRIEEHVCVCVCVRVCVYILQAHAHTNALAYSREMCLYWCVRVFSVCACSCLCVCDVNAYIKKKYVSARPYESCKILKGRPRRNAFSKLVHRQYKSFPPDRFCQVEIKKTTGLSNKHRTA